MPSREGGCSTGVFESLIICNLWNRVVKLMAKWHRASTGEVSGGPKSHLWGSIGKIGKSILVKIQMSSEMLIGLA